MRLGYGLLTAQRHPLDLRPRADLYAEAIALAIRADELALHSVWTSEHHFADDGYLPSQLILLAAIAARTSRVRLGAGVILAPLHNPIRLAEDVAVLDLLSRGRVILGLGLGWRAEEFEAFGVAPQQRGKRLEGVVAVLRQAWASGLTYGDGTHFSYPGVNVTPRPHGKRGVPIWIGGSADIALRRAAQWGDGYFGTTISPVELERRRDLMTSRRDRRDSRPFQLAVHWMVFPSVAKDPWLEIRDAAWYRYWKYQELGNSRGSLTATKAPLATERDYAAVRKRVIVGRPEEVAAEIREFEGALGRDGLFVAGSYFPGLSPEVQAETLELLASAVMPLVAADGTESRDEVTPTSSVDFRGNQSRGRSGG